MSDEIVNLEPAVPKIVAKLTANGWTVKVTVPEGQLLVPRSLEKCLKSIRLSYKSYVNGLRQDLHRKARTKAKESAKTE